MKTAKWKAKGNAFDVPSGKRKRTILFDFMKILSQGDATDSTRLEIVFNFRIWMQTLKKCVIYKLKIEILNGYIHIWHHTSVFWIKKEKGIVYKLFKTLHRVSSCQSLEH